MTLENKVTDTDERFLDKNDGLFEQFKCIIARIGAPDASAHHDSWCSVPLSEIDFSHCLVSCLAVQCVSYYATRNDAMDCGVIFLNHRFGLDII